MPIRAKQIDSSQRVIIPLAANSSVAGNLFTAIGGDEFDPSIYPEGGLRITFVARISTTDASNPARIRLFNVTDGYTVFDAQFSTTSLDIERNEVELTVPDDLLDEEKSYEVQLATTNTGDVAICQKCELILTWDNT